MNKKQTNKQAHKEAPKEEKQNIEYKNLENKLDKIILQLAEIIDILKLKKPITSEELFKFSHKG